MKNNMSDSQALLHTGTTPLKSPGWGKALIVMSIFILIASILDVVISSYALTLSPPSTLQALLIVEIITAAGGVTAGVIGLYSTRNLNSPDKSNITHTTILLITLVLVFLVQLGLQITSLVMFGGDLARIISITINAIFKIGVLVCAGQRLNLLYKEVETETEESTAT